MPSDEDLLRTLRRGINASGMPNWVQLSEEELGALVVYVRSFAVEALIEDLGREIAEGALTAEEAEEIFAEDAVPGPRIVVPPEPEFDDGRRERARETFLIACAPCHGIDGEPTGDKLKADFEGNLLLPPSLVAGNFKGGSEGDRLYVRILKGINGTAMPGYEGAFSPDEIWGLVHYVRSLAVIGRPGSEDANR